MKTSDMVRELCEKRSTSIAELCRNIGQTPQNFNKKLKRDTVSVNELVLIAKAMGVRYEQAFIFPDGRKISLRVK